MSEADTRQVVDRLYRAYFEGNQAGMLAEMSDDVEVRFLGQATVRGIDEARRFFQFSGARLVDLDFRIRRRIIDGDWAAVTWEETAVTAGGEPWENHGVDVFRVVGRKIVLLHENNDVRLVHQHFPRYKPNGE